MIRRLGRGPLLGGLLALALASTACGYRPLLRDATAPGQVQRIAVPLLVNDTEQVGLEIELTGALIDRLDRYRAIAITDKEADATLRGTIRGASLRPTQAVAGGGERHQGFRVALILDLQLVRASDGAVLWQSMALRREAEYDMGPVITGEDVLAAEDLRYRALVAAGSRAVEEGVELMMGGS
jgi:hypothetical protein